MERGSSPAKLGRTGALSFFSAEEVARARSYHPPGKATTRNRLAFFAPLTYAFTGGYKALPTLMRQSIALSPS